MQDAFPALPVLTPDELVGFRRVMRAHLYIVPLNLLSGPVGHVAEVVRLCGPAGILEVRAGRRAETLARQDPLVIVAGRTRERLRRRLVALELLFGQQLGR